MAFTATSPSIVKQKIAMNVPMAVALQLTDRADYAAAVGRSEGLEPGPFAGRGLVKDKPPLEFQTALPVPGGTEAERGAGLQALFQQMAAVWQGARPDPVPMVPAVVTLESLFQASPRLNGNQFWSVPLALDTELVVPFRVNLVDGPHFTIVGNAQCGKTTLLQSWLLALATYLPPDRMKLYVADFKDGALGPFGRLPHVIQYIDDDDQFSAAVTEITEEMTRRKDAAREARKAAGGVLDEAAFMAQYPVLVMAIDDYDTWHNATGAVSQEAFGNLLRMSRGPSFHLLLTGDVNDIGGNLFDTAIKALVNEKSGFLLATRDDGGVFANVKVPPEPKEFKPGEGYYVSRGVCHQLIKGACPDPGTLLRWLDWLSQQSAQPVQS